MNLFLMLLYQCDSVVLLPILYCTVCKKIIIVYNLNIVYKYRLLRWTYPQLHAHFAMIELSPEVITAQWFLTLFTYTFPVVPTVLQLWDYIFLTGWEGNCYERLICYCICTVDNGEQTVLLVYF